jgi:hypothetical protein
MARKRKRDQAEASQAEDDRTEGDKNETVVEQEQPVALPEGVHHYATIDEVPWDLQNYWRQGYSIFSRYDEGIWMTDAAWYGVTHESIAQ